MKYEIRPHHAFTGWVLVFRDGVSLGAFTRRIDAEEFIQKRKNLEAMKQRAVTL